MKRTLIALALLIPGCRNNDERLLEMAREHEAHQREQSQQMASMQHEVAEGSRRLVEEDAKAREGLSTMQAALRGDQAIVATQRDVLESERRAIAEQRNRDPVVAAAILQVGMAVAALLPLVLAGYLIHSLKSSAAQDNAAITELLVTELVSDQPRLLGPPAQRLLLPAKSSEPAASETT